MKRYWLLALLIFSYLVLTSCASHHNPYPRSDYTEERWMNEVATNPDHWAQGADDWFLTGDANSAETMNRKAPYTEAVSTMMVNVGDFSKIKIMGDFQVQLFGSSGRNSAYIYGPNDGVRNIAVSVGGDTLWIKQIGPSLAIKKVIVRIGVDQLTQLAHLGGCANVEGVRLNSPLLDITAYAGSTGNMYLAGNINTREIVNAGQGTISVFGTTSSELVIKTANRGSVNIAGDINLRMIAHSGFNDINVIGANGLGPVKIIASGAGRVSINGRSNIREIKASDQVAVFAYPVLSNGTKIQTTGDARVGLQGATTNLKLHTHQYSRFWGRNFCAQNVYVRAKDHSHANIASTNKVFASASESASIYFFGSPDLMTPFVSGNGVIIPMLERTCLVSPPARSMPVDYKGELRREIVYRHEVRREVVREREVVVREAASPHLSKPNPYVWKNKKLVENKSFLNK